MKYFLSKNAIRKAPGIQQNCINYVCQQRFNFLNRDFFSKFVLFLFLVWFCSLVFARYAIAHIVYIARINFLASRWLAPYQRAHRGVDSRTARKTMPASMRTIFAWPSGCVFVAAKECMNYCVTIKQLNLVPSGGEKQCIGVLHQPALRAAVVICMCNVYLCRWHSLHCARERRKITRRDIRK